MSARHVVRFESLNVRKTVVRTIRRTFTASLAVAALLAPTAARLEAQTLTFNGLPSADPAGVVYVNNCYMEAGFQVSITGLACGTPNAFATYTPADPTGYTGSPALFNNDVTQPVASVDFMLMGGGTFSFTSIGLAPIFFPGLPMTVTFTGMRMVGGAVTQTVSLANGASSLATFNFANFTNLSSLRLAPSAPDFAVQFDNVAFSNAVPAVIPEPSTYLLMATGLAGLLTVARRRRAAR